MTVRMTRRTELGLWLAAIAIGVAGLYLWRISIPKVTTAPPRSVVASHEPLMFDEDALGATADSVINRDPFRLDRHPSAVAFGAPPIPTTPSPQSGNAADAITLKGIIGGPPWQAVLAGVPNRNGNIVAVAGDTLAGLRIRAVTRSSVVIAGPDSIRTLTIKSSWQ